MLMEDGAIVPLIHRGTLDALHLASALPKGDRIATLLSMSTQLGAYLRFTLPTATSVLSRLRHPRPPRP